MSLYAGGLNTLKAVQDEGLAGMQTSFGDAAWAQLVETIHNLPFSRILSAIIRNEKAPADLSRMLYNEKQETILRLLTIKNGESNWFYDIIYFILHFIPYMLDPILFVTVAMFFIFHKSKLTGEDIFIRSFLSFITVFVLFVGVCLILPPGWEGKISSN